MKPKFVFTIDFFLILILTYQRPIYETNKRTIENFELPNQIVERCPTTDCNGKGNTREGFVTHSSAKHCPKKLKTSTAKKSINLKSATSIHLLDRINTLQNENLHLRTQQQISEKSNFETPIEIDKSDEESIICDNTTQTFSNSNNTFPGFQKQFDFQKTYEENIKLQNEQIEILINELSIAKNHFETFAKRIAVKEGENATLKNEKLLEQNKNWRSSLLNQATFVNDCEMTDTNFNLTPTYPRTAEQKVDQFWLRIQEERKKFAAIDQVDLSFKTDTPIGTYISKDPYTNGRTVFMGPKGGIFYISITGSRVPVDKIAQRYRVQPFPQT